MIKFMFPFNLSQERIQPLLVSEFWTCSILFFATEGHENQLTVPNSSSFVQLSVLFPSVFFNKREESLIERDLPFYYKRLVR